MKTIQQLYTEKRGTLLNAGIGALVGGGTEGPDETSSGRTLAGGVGGVLAGRLAGRGLMGNLAAAVGGSIGGTMVDVLREKAEEYLVRTKLKKSEK